MKSNGHNACLPSVYSGFGEEGLYINFKTRFIAGTDYCASDYPMDDTSPIITQLQGFNEPVTAYMRGIPFEKRYRLAVHVFDNGENLLWYYDKILDLASGSTSAVGTTLLAGTRSDVSRQTDDAVLHLYDNGKEDFHKFKLQI